MRLIPETVLGAPKRSNPTLNAAGTLAVYTQSTYSFRSQTEKKEIRVVDLATGRSCCVTENPNARSPQWVSKSNQLIWLEWLESGNTDLVVGDAQCTTTGLYKAGTVPGQAFDLKVTGQLPFREDDDNQLAFAISGRANPDGSLVNPRQIAESTGHSTGRFYTTFPVRDECSYVSGLKNSIWYGFLRRGSEPGSRYCISGISNLMIFAGLEGLESPMSPLGGEETSREFEINPFGMVFVARDREVNKATHTACSCYVQSVERWDQQNRDLIYPVWRYRGLGGAISSLAVDKSDESRPIAFLSQKRDGNKADKNRIIYIPAPGSYDVYEIFASADGNGLWDLSPCAISFGNNRTLLIQTEQSGRVMLYHLKLDRCREGLRPAALRPVDPWCFGSIAHVTPVRSDSSRILITHSSLVETPTWNIFDLAALTESPKILSASRTMGIELSKAQVDVIWFDSTGNRRIHAWVIKPSNFDPQQRYPLAYFIHSGPHSAWNNQWSIQWNLALFAEQGFVVVAPNPAGSSGFGQAFKDSSLCSWGGLPYTDLERGFEYLQQNESLQYIDTARSIAVGAGYGGYMVNWIQGHELGRKFKALVTHDGIFCMTSQLASNRQHFVKEIGGPIWETPDEWRKWDPARFTASWQTPHLVIHCELNYKRVIADGLAAFNVLQLRGVDSALLVFPDEGDPILNPENNLLWYRTVIDWMRKYCDQKSDDH
ncbi:probable dipeptidyl-peptidase 5 [Aspergillus udagawae]|nr:probable dipeptidyl-peptidase 5 [Aspergillus udagawae]